MGIFIVCYLMVWVAVTSYVAHLGARQSLLRQRIDDLKQRIENQVTDDSTRSRAA